MFAVPVICYIDQALIKTFLICAAFVPAYKQNSLTLWIECKSYAPYLAYPVKSHLFHVGMRTSFKRINGWAAQIGSKLSQQLCVSEQLILQLFLQRHHLISKVVVKKYGPFHASNYDFKSI